MPIGDWNLIEKLERLARYEKSLILIQKLGEKYSGFGMSCAKIAENALTGEPLSEQTKKTIKLVE